MRIALAVEYDGSRYHGWQAQPGLYTVQTVLETALSQVANEPITVACAGRTDTGVHATHQIVHFDTDKIRTVRAWIHGANTFLPKDVAVKWGRETSPDFHARYSALSRRYRYIIYNSSIRPALLRGKVTWQYRQLDQKAMQIAGQYLVGEHDYSSFRSTECQSNSPIRAVHQLEVKRIGELVIIDITANAYLHHMVRNIAGVLIAVGNGKKSVPWVNEILEAKDRKLAAETAPPYGLYLVNVTYPAEFNIQKPYNIGPFFLGDS